MKSLWTAAQRAIGIAAAGILIAGSFGVVAHAETTVVYVGADYLSQHDFFDLPSGILQPNQALFVVFDYVGLTNLSGDLVFDPSFGTGYSDWSPGGPDNFQNYHTMFVQEPLCYIGSCLQPTSRPQEYAAVLHGPALYATVYDCLSPSDGVLIGPCLLDLGTSAITGAVNLAYGAVAPDAFVRITFSDQPISVPEPTAWTLLVLGFGSLGCALRRARRSRLASA
jgi:hypothetical protein